jgi:curved DNA-binding protein CbpA
MSSEYKQKSDLPDLYNILGLTVEVCNEPNCDELIQKAYIRKAKICHPDKHPGRKDVNEVFELLTSTYEILKNEKQRNAYNHKVTLKKQSSNDFFKLKNEASKNQTVEIVKPTQQQLYDFTTQQELLNTKHGYDSSMTGPIPTQDAKVKMNNMTKLRSEQDSDLKPERLFDEGKFNIRVFNEAFDMVHKKTNSIIPHNGVPSAWNDVSNIANFSSFDNLDNLYVEDNQRLDTNRQSYSNVDFGDTVKKLTKNDISDLHGIDYCEDYYGEDLKTKLQEREAATAKLGDMKYQDYKLDDTAGYGIFDQLGLKLDSDLELEFDIDEDDISHRLDKLLAERQNFIPHKNIK